MKAPEMHVTATEAAFLLRCSVRHVKDEIKRGAFGPDCFEVAGQYVIAASAFNAYLEQHRVTDIGIVARTQGEFRRKFAVKHPDGAASFLA